MTSPSNDQDLTARLYRSLYRIRRVEEEIALVYPTDKIKSPVHLSIGQESVAVGVCDCLRTDDVVVPTYRGHAAYLAKGGSLAAMIAELYGKATGCAGGKGGSMHLVGMGQFIVGASAVVGTTIPVAAGFALALEREAKERIAVAFFGDGATEEGVFYETLNFAALHQLPLLFVCENNSFAIHSPLAKRWASPQLCERVRTFGIEAQRINAADVFEVRNGALSMISKVRGGGGPALIECETYRWREHVGPGEDYESGYRSRDELEKWQASDSVHRAGSMLGGPERGAIEAAVESEIRDAFAFAEAAPWPPVEDLMRGTYAG